MSTPGTITFVPSVHFSPTHRRRVRETIRTEAPDLVAVELDEFRFERLARSTRPDPADVVRAFSPATAATYTTVKAIQQTVVRLYGLDPGPTDMEAAIETAAEREIDLALIDDPIEETLSALAACVGPATGLKLLLRLQRMGPQAQARQLELLTLPFKDIEHGDDVQPAIDQLRWLFPELADVLIDRRDRTMARRLHRLRRAGHDVVAIIGAGHHNGIRHALDDLERRDSDPELSVPIRSPPRAVTRIPIEEA